MKFADAAQDNNKSRVELQFYLFNQTTNITVGEVFFDAVPSLAKFCVRLFDWPWTSGGDYDNKSIEMRMKLTPSFTAATRLDDTPRKGITTFVLSGQALGSTDAQTQLRLVDSIELDGVDYEGGVRFHMDALTSELVLEFDHFNSTLVYDPGS
jgi:hypothetical protein